MMAACLFFGTPGANFYVRPFPDKGPRFLDGGKSFVTGTLESFHLSLGTGITEPLGVDARISAGSHRVVFFFSHVC
jgi:hypothetical protein